MSVWMLLFEKKKKKKISNKPFSCTNTNVVYDALPVPKTLTALAIPYQ